MQNADGGFASYELTRGSKHLELLNPAEVFGKIMVEYSYPECTTSVVTALSLFKKHQPDYRREDIERTTNAAIKYIHAAQREDGSWYGSWAICFTYAAMFALESLSSVGEHYENSEKVRKACEFLLSKQKEDGGWGESYLSCETEEYTQHQDSQVVQTSWVVLALLHARYPHKEPIKRAVRLIMSRQNKDGSWTQEAIEVSGLMIFKPSNADATRVYSTRIALFHIQITSSPSQSGHWGRRIEKWVILNGNDVIH